MRTCKLPGESSFRNRRSNAGNWGWWSWGGRQHGGGWWSCHDVTVRGDGDGNNQMRHREAPACLVMGLLGEDSKAVADGGLDGEDESSFGEE